MKDQLVGMFLVLESTGFPTPPRDFSKPCEVMTDNYHPIAKPRSNSARMV
jgi:hypothetical protein